MSHRFELAVWTPEDTVLAAADYLRGVNAATATWRPHLDDSALLVQAEGREWLGGEWNLGNVEQLVAQFLPARDRLRARQAAIIRSAVHDQPDVPYLSFDPVDADRVEISLFFITDERVKYLYPGDELYTFIEDHGRPEPAELPDDLAELCFGGVSFPYGGLVESLEREARVGEELISVVSGGSVA